MIKTVTADVLKIRCVCANYALCILGHLCAPAPAVRPSCRRRAACTNDAGNGLGAVIRSALDEGPQWAVFSRVQMAEMPRFALT